ncbi:MAG: pilus assembly FimT family protein [Luteolibacter sp.]|jgi:prepilin-type N-terminal cleavage/methylation domain-containing protein
MMTSIVKRCEDRAGFTLLEIVIVLMIAAIIMGGALGVMVFSSDEYALKKASREVEGLAKRARSTAILKQIPYALEFSPGMVRLMPWAEAIGGEELADWEDRIEMESDVQSGGAVRWELSLDNGMASQMRRWDSDEWIEIDDGAKQLWRFDPDGLSEPIALEFALEGGSISMEFNPLTAAIDTLYFENR